MVKVTKRSQREKEKQRAEARTDGDAHEGKERLQE